METGREPRDDGESLLDAVADAPSVPIVLCVDKDEPLALDEAAALPEKVPMLLLLAVPIPVLNPELLPLPLAVPVSLSVAAPMLIVLPKLCVAGALPVPVPLPPVALPLPHALTVGPALLSVARTEVLPEPLPHPVGDALDVPVSDALALAHALPVLLNAAVLLLLALPPPLLVPIRDIVPLRLAAPLRVPIAELLALLQGVGEREAEGENRGDAVGKLEPLGIPLSVARGVAEGVAVSPPALPLPVPVAHLEGGALAAGAAVTVKEPCPVAETLALPAGGLDARPPTEFVELALAVRIADPHALKDADAQMLHASSLAVAAALPEPVALPLLKAAAVPPAVAVAQPLPVRAPVLLTMTLPLPLAETHGEEEGKDEMVPLCDTLGVALPDALPLAVPAPPLLPVAVPQAVAPP